MGISIFYDDEDRSIVHFGFIKHWSWKDLYVALDLAERMCKREAIDLVIDVRYADPMPSNVTLNLNAMNRAKGFANRADAIGCAVVFLGMNAMIKSMYFTFRAVQAGRGENVAFCVETTSAREFIHQRRRERALLTVDLPA